MNTLLFVALATAEPGGGYRASFPDLPECVVTASDLAGILQAARQALAAHLQRTADAGDVWPKPTSIEAIPPATGMIPLLVDVAVDVPPVRVIFSLGERLVQRLDAAAEARGMTRSGFIAQAVRMSLGEQSRGAADFDAASRRVLDELSSLGHRINDSLGPDSAFNRRMTEWDDRLLDGVRRAADSVSAAMSRRREAAKPAGPDASAPSS
jgi:predicted RNase H-like HicB family nuclease